MLTVRQPRQQQLLLPPQRPLMPLLHRSCPTVIIHIINSVAIHQVISIRTIYPHLHQTIAASIT